MFSFKQNNKYEEGGISKKDDAERGFSPLPSIGAKHP